MAWRVEAFTSGPGRSNLDDEPDMFDVAQTINEALIVAAGFLRVGAVVAIYENEEGVIADAEEQGD